MTPEEFGAKLAQAVRNGLPQQCRVVTVTAVDAATWTVTVTPIDSEAELHDVRLRASTNAAEMGVLIVPKIGSTALLQIIGNDPDLAWLARVDEPDRVLIRVASDFYLEASASGVQLNGDACGGLVKLQSLVGKLNQLENLVNALSTAVASHTHVVATVPGGGMVASPSGVNPGSLTPTAPADLENPNVTHG